MHPNVALQIVQNHLEARRLKNLRRPAAKAPATVSVATATKAAAMAAELAIDSHEALRQVQEIDRQLRAYLPSASEPRFTGTGFAVGVMTPAEAKARLAQLGGAR